MSKLDVLTSVENKIKDLFPEDSHWIWAAKDQKLAGDMRTIFHLDDHVFPVINNYSIAIQAGGAMGLWAKRLAQKFNAVYTFEPTPESFRACVANNIEELNVHCFNAGLGEKPEFIEMGFPRDPVNFGGFRVLKGGDVPVLPIDVFEFPLCGLLMLDIEGYELFALRGAVETIKRCKPVIVLEDKHGCCTDFGYKVGDCEKFLAQFGYQTYKRFHGGRDVIVLHELHPAFNGRSRR
jgi:FkbM family methyltransferase